MPEFYRRHLPHKQPDAGIIFVTFRTINSLPNQVTSVIANSRKNISRDLQAGKISFAEYLMHRKKLFLYYDRALDSAAPAKSLASSLHLRQYAEIIQRRIRVGGELKKFILHSYCIMPTHVHLLIEPLCPKIPLDMPLTPQFPSATQNILELRHDQKGDPGFRFFSLSKIMDRLKGSIAHDINAVAGRTGALFQPESFDHFVRDREEYGRIIKYIEQNPVAAGLVSRPDEWPWGSAGEVTA